MAKPWADVAASPAFQSLSAAEQDEVRRQYFEAVVAPQVPEEDIDVARSQFDQATRIAKVDAAGAGAGEGRSGSPMGQQDPRLVTPRPEEEEQPKPVSAASAPQVPASAPAGVSRIAPAKPQRSGTPIIAAAQASPAVTDPMGSDFGAAIMAEAQPKKSSVLEGVEMPAQPQRSFIERRGAPVSEQKFDELRRQYDAATPQQRAKLLGAKDYTGSVFRSIDEQYKELGRQQSKSGELLPDTRREARRKALVEQGLDLKAADALATSDAAAGAEPRVLGTIKPSTFDFDTKRDFARPTGRAEVKETGGVLSARTVSPTGIQQAATSAKAIGGKVSGQFKSASAGAYTLIGDLLGTVGNVLDSDGVNDFGNKLSSGAQALRKKEQQKLEAIGNNPNKALDFIESGVSGAITNIAPFFVAGPQAGMAVVIGQVFAEEYGNGREAGLSGDQAYMRASLLSAAEYIGEKASLPTGIIKKFKDMARGVPADDIMPAFARYLAKENLAEQVTTSMNFATDKWTPFGLTPNAGLSDYFQAVGDTFYQTTAQTLVMGGVGRLAAAAGRKINGANPPPPSAEQMARDRGFLVSGTARQQTPAAPAVPAVAPAAGRAEPTLNPNAPLPSVGGTEPSVDLNNLPTGGQTDPTLDQGAMNFTPPDSPSALAGLAPIVVTRGIVANVQADAATEQQFGLDTLRMPAAPTASQPAAPATQTPAAAGSQPPASPPPASLVQALQGKTQNGTTPEEMAAVYQEWADRDGKTLNLWRMPDGSLFTVPASSGYTANGTGSTLVAKIEPTAGAATNNGGTTNVGANGTAGSATVAGSVAAGNQPGGSVGAAGSDNGGTGQQLGGNTAGAAPNVQQANAAGGAASEQPAAVGTGLPATSEADMKSRVEAGVAAKQAEDLRKGLDGGATGAPQDNNANIQPAEQWFGRKGDGYQTQGDAQQALPGRQRMFPDLTWSVEQMPNGKYRLAGYAGNQQQETASGTQASQAQQGQAQGQEAPAASPRQPDLNLPQGALPDADVARLGSNPQSASVRASVQQSLNRWATSTGNTAPQLGAPDQDAQTTVNVLGALVGEATGLGQKVIAYNNPGGENGFSYGGYAFVNTAPDVNVAAPRTTLHEIKHVVERMADADTKAGRTNTPAQKFVAEIDSIFDDMTDAGKRAYVANFLHKEELDGIKDSAKREARLQQLIADPKTRSEMTADFLGNRSQDRAFLIDLAKTDPKGFEGFVQKWLAVIDNLIDKLKGTATQGRKESAKVDQYVRDLNKAKMVARDALIAFRRGNLGQQQSQQGQQQSGPVPSAKQNDTRTAADFQNLKWSPETEDTLSADVGNGWTASIYMNEDGTAELSVLDPRGVDFGNAVTYADVNTARNAAPAVIARRRTEDGMQPGAEFSKRERSAEEKKAKAYEKENGILPYVSEGQLKVDVAVEGDPKFSIKQTGKYEQHPIFDIPLNKNGTVTLYYPTTNAAARAVARDRKLTGATPASNRIYLTNESSGPKVMNNPGAIEQKMDGANVLVQVDPSLLQLDQEHSDGRKDFFIPIAEGAAFDRKMKQVKLFTMNAPRDKGLSPDTTIADITDGIAAGVDRYSRLSPKEKRIALKEAKAVLKREHNVGTLLGENGKLEKTRVGDYGLTYDGKSVASLGLGMASAQKINDQQKLTTCPQSAICESLCLGETSGQNLLYGGEGQFKSGPRLSQYLKTEALVLHPQEFAIALHSEIERFARRADKEDFKVAIRLNVTSDFNPKVFESLINAFPDVMFYDYTKLATTPIAPNHHLTYSSTGASQVVNGKTVVNKESNWNRMVQRMNKGFNVAMAFSSRTDMPSFILDEKTGERFQVWNGDNYDARFLDPKPGEEGNLLNKGMVIGLTNKDRTGKPEEAAVKNNGFFLDYDRARDGDTLTIRDQDALASGKAKPIKIVRRSEMEQPAFSKRETTPLGFYSALSDGVTNLKASALPVVGWKDAIKGMVNKGQVKADEIQWTGINEWLDLQEGKVTKEQVQEYLSGNGVQVEETVLGGSKARWDGNTFYLDGRKIGEIHDEEGYIFREINGATTRLDGYRMSEAVDEVQAMFDVSDDDVGSSPKYANYGPPGGENYREVLLTLPLPRASEAEARAVAGEAAWNRMTPAQREQFRSAPREADKKRQYRSSHWDQANVLAHLRVDDRTDADGKRVLFIREIQSDWGQEGKKEGFGRETMSDDRLRELIMQADENADVDGLPRSTLLEMAANVGVKGGPIPAAPFVAGYKQASVAPVREEQVYTDRAGNQKKRNVEIAFRVMFDDKQVGEYATRAEADAKAEELSKRKEIGPDTEAWVSLALKRAIIMATEQGYDRVALINGEQAADMFDLSKQIEQVTSYRLPDGGFKLSMIAAGRNTAEPAVTVADEAELEGAVGKELAQKIVSDKDDVNTWRGLDLRVGGEGMKAFYDNIVPKVAKDVLKKLGGQVGAVQIDTQGTGLNAKREWQGPDVTAQQVRARAAEGDFPVAIERQLKDIANAMDAGESFAQAQQKYGSIASAEAMGGSMVASKQVMSQQLGFDITPEMRAKVEEGVPMFSRRTPATGWRDEAGRIRFMPGEVAYRTVADIASNLLAKTPLIGSLKPIDEDLSIAMRRMKAEVERAQRRTAGVASKLGELPKDERELISDVIEGELKSGVLPPPRVLSLAASMQSIMSEQSAELVRLGMLTQDAASRWDGKYLPRFYERTLKDEASQWAKAARALLGRKKTMQGIGGSSLKGRGIFETIPVSELQQYVANGWEERDPNFDPAVDQEIVVWRDYTRDERENMGEIRDAMFRFVMGYMKSQRDIALGRLYENLAGTIASKSEKEGYVQVPRTNVEDTTARRYGALAGKWVPQEVMDHLSAFDSNMEGDLLKVYRKALSMWKEGKTVLNPVAHANNILGNLTMAHFAGVSYWDANKYLGAVKDLVTSDPMVEEARDVGLFGGTVSQAELVSMLPDELKQLASKTESKVAKGVDTVWSALSLFLRKPMGIAYEAEDLFFRYLVYRDARGRGMDPEDATTYAQQFIFAYDDLPKGARTIRDSPVGIPFFSWTYKAIPVIAHTAAAYPWRFAAPAAAMYALNAGMYAIAAGMGGGDDEPWWEVIKRYVTDPEFREQAKALEKEERKNLPEWQKGYSSLGTPKAIRLGEDDLTGLPLFLDVSRIFPGGDLGDFTNNAGGIPLPAWLTPNNPVLTSLTAFLQNKDSFTGKEIVSPKLDTGGEKGAKWGEYAWRQFAPAIAPFNYHFDRTMNAIANATDSTIDLGIKEYTGVDKQGQPVQPKYAAMQTFGIKARPTDLDVSAEIAKSQREAMVRELDKQIRQIKRLENKGFYSPEKADSLREPIKEKRQRLKEGLTIEGEEQE